MIPLPRRPWASNWLENLAIARPGRKASMAANIESLTLKRVAYRFIPFLMLCYFVNYLDRVNVGFAKLTMDADPGLFFVRGSVERHHGPGRRANLDRANHDFMGHHIGSDGLYSAHRCVDGL